MCSYLLQRRQHGHSVAVAFKQRIRMSASFVCHISIPFVEGREYVCPSARDKECHERSIKAKHQARLDSGLEYGCDIATGQLLSNHLSI